ncbi:GNAT family N-acetyltransferase [Streptomyces sp. NPDC101455]|uniref:GNAT family N-acetyltransferase n=1 Tax=Streptomyces sp. NPDC101455 TaxID=3366142 RepID=UPI0037FFF620
MSQKPMRQATTADLPSVLELLGQEWPVEGSDVGAELWARRLQYVEGTREGQPDLGVWLLDDDGVVLAIAVTRHLWSPKRVGGQDYSVYLEYLTTRVGHRGQGFASQLATQVTRAMAERGHSGAYLWTNPEPSGEVRFWEGQGWQRAPDAAQPARPPRGILMVKTTVINDLG